MPSKCVILEEPHCKYSLEKAKKFHGVKFDSSDVKQHFSYVT